MNLNRRRLPGAVRTEQPEAFATVDVEVEAVDRDNICIPFHETATENRRTRTVHVRILIAACYTG